MVGGLIIHPRTLRTLSKYEGRASGLQAGQRGTISGLRGESSYRSVSVFLLSGTEVTMALIVVARPGQGRTVDGGRWGVQIKMRRDLCSLF